MAFCTGMHVLVDGLNLLWAARADVGGTWHLGRSQLCRMLGEWATRTASRLTVVFDGRGPDGPLADQLGDPRIDVRQSGVGRTADEVLTECLREYSGVREALVVSSDRAVQATARHRGAQCVRSEEFFRQLRRVLSAAPEATEPGEKWRGLEADDGVRWLREFGLEPNSPRRIEEP